MKRFLKFLLWLVAGLVVAGVVAFGYYGGFRRVTFEVTTLGGETLVFKQMTGDYANSGTVMEQVREALGDKYNVLTDRCFGTYYDNPNITAKENLRYDAGCIVEAIDSVQLVAVQGEFRVGVVPVKGYVSTTFPYRGKMSILAALTKVYPALYRYMADNGLMERAGAVTEIYDLHGGHIEYRVELLDAEGAAK
ncbi:MAG: GyrI-like domain-containing protein [Rikenellaceae bacterium]|jgi:hypothetical protein|nr:GyrI-like domain-containing protein [Rikenellaceae bacterium]